MPTSFFGENKLNIMCNKLAVAMEKYHANQNVNDFYFIVAQDYLRALL